MMEDLLETPAGGGLGGKHAGSQYLCFWLGSQSYALPVLAVEEIRAAAACTALPGYPDWLLGVMNLRGQVIPVLDLRLRFGRRAEPPDAPPVMIVVSSGGRLAGLVVDGVDQVMELESASLRPPSPGPDPSGGGEPVAAVCAVGGQVVVVLNPAALLNQGERANQNAGLVQ